MPQPIRFLLHLEGAAIAALGIAAYAALEQGWWHFAALILAPDIAMLGYLRGPLAGAVAYKLAHSYRGPLALGALGHATDTATAVAAALIWVVHIGAGRAMGHGLKNASRCTDTHLGRL